MRVKKSTKSPRLTQPYHLQWLNRGVHSFSHILHLLCLLCFNCYCFAINIWCDWFI